VGDGLVPSKTERNNLSLLLKKTGLGRRWGREKSRRGRYIYRVGREERIGRLLRNQIGGNTSLTSQLSPRYEEVGGEDPRGKKSEKLEKGERGRRVNLVSGKRLGTEIPCRSIRSLLFESQ